MLQLTAPTPLKRPTASAPIFLVSLLKYEPSFGVQLTTIYLQENISKRGIPCCETCVSCYVLVEFHMHLFFVSHKAMACWNLLGIGSIIQDLLYRADSFHQQILFDLLHKLHDHQTPLVAMIIWSFWKSQNLLLWEDNDTTPTLTITRAQEVLYEWSCFQKVKHPEQHVEQHPS